MVNIVNLLDRMDERKMLELEKWTNESTNLIYTTKVREWKENNEFTKERQEEAMQDVVDRVHQLTRNEVLDTIFGYMPSILRPTSKAEDHLIRMLCEDRIADVKSRVNKKEEK